MAQAERKSEVEPDGVADDLGREPMSGVAGGGGRRHPVRLPNPTLPQQAARAFSAQLEQDAPAAKPRCSLIFLDFRPCKDWPGVSSQDENALVLQPGFTLRALCSSAPMGAPGALLMFPSPC